MPAVVLGLGIGLFTLLLLWSLAILVCIFTFHSRGWLSLSGFVLATIVTLLLASLPTELSSDHLSVDSGVTLSQLPPPLYDPLYVWRLVLTVFVLLSTGASVFAAITLHYNQPLLAKPQRHLVVYR